MDIKVYTVGPSYAHAEGRKSPAMSEFRKMDPATDNQIISIGTDQGFIFYFICYVFDLSSAGIRSLPKIKEGNFKRNVN